MDYLKEAKNLQTLANDYIRICERCSCLEKENLELKQLKKMIYTPSAVTKDNCGNMFYNDNFLIINQTCNCDSPRTLVELYRDELKNLRFDVDSILYQGF